MLQLVQLVAAAVALMKSSADRKVVVSCPDKSDCTKPLQAALSDVPPPAKIYLGHRSVLYRFLFPEYTVGITGRGHRSACREWRALGSSSVVHSSKQPEAHSPAWC